MKVAFSILFCFNVAVGFGQVHDTMHIYFELDHAQLSDRGTKLIDSIIHDNRLLHDRKITIMGYTDYLGSDAYDKTLSAARAKNVEDYLVVSGYNKNDITRCTGKGKINRTPVKGKQGFSDDRKVDIIFDARKDTSDDQRFGYDLAKMQVNDAMPLKNIEFFRGSLRLTPESTPRLEILIRFLQQNPAIIFQLEGHVCCLGGYNDGHDEPYDEGTLSQKRAQVIYDYLVANGIPKERIKAAIGLGDLHPIAEVEETEADQQLNRRVEIRIISK